MLDNSVTFPILSSALALLTGLLLVSGIFGRVCNPKPTNQVSGMNRTQCPPAEAAATNDKDVWEVPHSIGELTVSKLLVHPIKVSLSPLHRLDVPYIVGLFAELSWHVSFGSEIYP